MDTKIEQLTIPLGHRFTELWDHQSTTPVLVALGVALISYLIYNVSILCYLSALNRASGRIDG